MSFAASDRRGFVARMLLVAAVYYGSAKLGLALAYAQGNVTAVWPPTGLALAVLVIWGRRFWPGVALGALLANVTTDVPALTAVGIAVGNTLEALVGATLLARVDFRPSLARVRDVLALVVCGAALSTMVSATIGNASLLLGGDIHFARLGFFWRLWWLGDMGGDLVVAPVLMLLMTRAAWPAITRRRAVEAAALAIAVVVVSLLALSPKTPLAFLAFPALVIAALRFRQFGAAAGSLIVALVAVSITANGGGPFAGGSHDENLLASQLFCGVGGLTALLLGAVLTERKRIEDTQRFLAETSKPLVASLDLDQTLHAVVHSAVPALADWCIVYMLDDGDSLEPVAMAYADPATESRLWELARRDAPDPDTPAAIARAVGTGRSELFEDGTGSVVPSAVAPMLPGLRCRSAVVAPLLARGRTLGGLALVSTEASARRFDGADLRVAEDLANRCALAADNARLYRHEHRVAETLQRSLLPDRLPEITGVKFAARYLPGGVGVDVGGDWYDAIQNPDGRLVLVIGDVAGRGIRAASTMGQLRTAARAYALEGRSPQSILTALNLLAHAAEFRDMATVLCVDYDASADELRVASAGHLPPLVISAERSVRRLQVPVSLPLNVDATTRFVEASERLEPGDTLFLYTDGLVERTDETLSEGLDRLERAASSAPKDVEALCDHIASHALSDADRPDDVALLALQVLPLEGRDLHLRLPARPEALADLRRSLRRWLEDARATDEEIFSVTLAAGEACANSIEHAYGPADAELEVTAVLHAGVMGLTVRDFGRWRPPRGEDRGRGFELMRQLMDEVVVSQERDGTVVQLSLRLAHGPAGAPSQDAAAKTPRADASPAPQTTADSFEGTAALRLSRDGDVVIAALVGEIDLANARDVFGRTVAALDNHAAGLILDLSATDYLDSSGLQSLLDLAKRTRVRGQRLRVVAPPESAPGRLLELVNAEALVAVDRTIPNALTAFESAAS